MRTLIENKSGFTLVELLVAMVTGIIVLAGIYTAFNTQQKIHTREQLAIEAAQNARAAAHFMVREIRLAGMNETGLAGSGFLVAGPHSIQFTLDRDDDEDTTDANEDISYGFTVSDDLNADGLADAGAAPIIRTAAGSDRLAEDIHAIGFAYAFDDNADGALDFVDGDGDGELDPGEEIWAYDSDAEGNLDWNNNTGVALASAVTFDKIRAVRVWVLARTRYPIRGHSGSKNFTVGDKPINVNDNFKYRLLTTTVKCRNMGI